MILKIDFPPDFKHSSGGHFYSLQRGQKIISLKLTGAKGYKHKPH